MSVYVGKNVNVTIQVPVEDEDETLKLCTLVTDEAVVKGDPNGSDALAHGNVQRIVRINNAAGGGGSTVDYIEVTDYLLGSNRASVDWSPGGSEPSTGATYYVTYYYMSGTQFTVDFTPISDRDMDGVANEVAHVTVKKNGVEITPSSVNDATGVVTLSAMPNAGDEITCSYRYDSTPFVAQELTVEPKQAVEGIDGLGSDTVQLWAILLDEIKGSIKEVCKVGSTDQLTRVASLNLDVFDTVTEKQVERYDGWSIRNQTWDNSKRSWENGKLKVGAGDDLLTYFRRAMALRDFVAEFKIDWTGSTASTTRIGWFWRYHSSGGGGYGWLKAYLFLIFPDGKTTLYKYFNLTSAPQPLAVKGGLSNPLDEHTIKIRMQGNNIKIWIDGTLWMHLTDNSYNTTTETGPALKGYAANHPYAYFDDVKISSIYGKADYGMIISWTQNSSVVKVGLNNVVFPEGSIPSPKNEPVFIVMPFEARTIKTIT